MSLLNQVQDDVKAAMKAGERERVHALRMVADALQKAEKDNGGEPVEVLSASGSGASRLPRPTATAAAPKPPTPNSARPT